MSILDQILAVKREEVDRLRPRKAELQRLAGLRRPARPFAAALRAGSTVAVIAEFKRRSPSAGWIAKDGSAAAITTAYSEAGARAISVLTDSNFFSGELYDLETAVAKTSVPILRKDFIVDPLQLIEARAAGADAALLIVRILTDAQLVELIGLARDLGFETLVEAHDASEVQRALAAGAGVIGINNRDLSSFQVDPELTNRMAAELPGNVVLVAESGVRTADDVARYGAAGIDAVLVGEALMRAADVHATLRAFAGQPRAVRS